MRVNNVRSNFEIRKILIQLAPRKNFTIALSVGSKTGLFLSGLVGAAGTNKIVSNWQCGHGMVSPA